MSSPEAGQTPENAAWAIAQISLPPHQVFSFLADVERLFRLNPHLEISDWRADTAAQSYQMSALNETSALRSETSWRVETIRENTLCTPWGIKGINSGYRLVYAQGLKRSTEFTIEPAAGGSQLTITERYLPVDDETDPRIREIDRSLVPWAAAIRRHLNRMARFGNLPGYRWWTERLLLRMPPRHRRISRMIFWVSVLEFIVFLFVALIFWLETR
ncbi:MAG: hypothetical protein HY066_13010 [Betaproteobacteria bacterium]|nr:hypothetical protein [Betaproteobacteria bacterium]